MTAGLDGGLFEKLVDEAKVGGSDERLVTTTELIRELVETVEVEVEPDEVLEDEALVDNIVVEEDEP